MKTTSTAITILSLALLVLWITGHACANDVWTVPVSDGKTETIQVDYSVCAVDLSLYYDSLRQIFPQNFIGSDPAQDRYQYQFKNLSIVKIGAWAEYEVLALTCTAAHHMSLMLKDANGKLRIAYLQFGSADMDAKPFVRKIGDDLLLCYAARIPGTGNNYIEHYFIYDQNLHRPKLLNVSAISEAIAKAIPTGFGVWKGGGLDIATLKYRNYVWQRDDANCRPTGGSIELALSISDGKIVVVNSFYDPKARP